MTFDRKTWVILAAAAAAIAGRAPARAASELSVIRQHGKDAVVTNGTVVSGTAFPELRFGYAPSGVSYTSFPIGPVRGISDNVELAEVGLARILSGDFNGDGRTDLAAVDGGGSSLPMNIYLASPGGSFLPAIPGPTRTLGATNELQLLDISRLRTGDFNGDGRTDFAAVEGYGGSAAIRVYLAKEDGRFLPPGNGPLRTIAGDLHGAQLDLARVRTGDFNGDGKTDLYAVEGLGSSAPIKIYLSTCADGVVGFAAPSLGPARSIGADVPTAALDVSRVFAADFDGDGLSDLGAIEGWGLAAPMSIWLARSDGSFGAAIPGPSRQITGELERAHLDLQRMKVGDVNGDGKTDLLFVEGYGAQLPVSVFVGTGDGRFQQAPPGPRRRVYASASLGSVDVDRVMLLDLDSDGKDDLVAVEGWGGPATMSLYRAIGDGRFAGREPGPTRTLSSTVARVENDLNRLHVGDFDGDARLDFAGVDSTGGAAQHVNIILGGGERTGLLASAENGLGGRVTVAYTPSSTWPNQNNPPVQVTVASVTTHDGRGNAATTGYHYSGGLIDRLGRRFLGYRYTRTVKPCLAEEPGCAREGDPTGPYEETWHYQSYGNVAKPEQTYVVAANGTTLAATVYEYDTNGDALPYRSQLAGMWGYAYSTDSSQVTYASSVFDEYGNVLEETLHGDFFVAGDEKTTRTIYRPNTTAYIVGKPAVVSTFDGRAVGGTLIAQSIVWYDEQGESPTGTWDTPPTQGKPTRSAAWKASCNCYAISEQRFDKWGNVVREIDALGHPRTHEFDPIDHEFLISTTDALNRKVSFGWDARCGVQTSVTDVRELTTTTVLDARCEMREVHTPDGKVATTELVGVGTPDAYVEQRLEPDGLWSRTYIDGLGRSVRVRAKGEGDHGDEVVTETEYTARGQTRRSSLPHLLSGAVRWVGLEYDALDRNVRTILADGAVATRSYGLGSVTAVDPLGHAVTEVTDPTGRAAEHRENVGGKVHVTRHVYGVYPDGIRWHEISDPLGNVIHRELDSTDELLLEIDPDRGTRSYVHDATGRLVQQTDNLGQQTVLAYDAIDRLVSKKTRAGTPDEVVVELVYDREAAGFFNRDRLTDVTWPGGQRRMSYDQLGRLALQTTTIDGTAHAREWHYDPLGRLAWMRYPDGDTLGSAAAPIGYDVLGRLDVVPGVISDVTYEPDGQVSGYRGANGTSTTLELDPQRRWLKGITTQRGATNLQKLTLTRNLDGNVIEVKSPFAGESWTYDYDELHRLTAAGNRIAALEQSFTYDAIGNMTFNSRVGKYTYNPSGPGSVRPHAVTTAGDRVYEYDDNGDMISSDGRAIEWDGDGRPVRIDGVTLAHDGLGERIKRSSNGVTTVYIGDDVESTNGVVTKHIAIGEVKVAKRVGTTTSWLHGDHLGSIQVVTDAAGAVVERRNYRPYGEVLSTGSTGETLGFTGQRQDLDVGLLYLHARYYDPSLGRFICADPFVSSGMNVGLNRYAYADNNPTNITDPDGYGFFRNLFRFIKRVATMVIPIAASFLPATHWLAITWKIYQGAQIAQAAVRGQWRNAMSGAAGMVIGKVLAPVQRSLSAGLMKATQSRLLTLGLTSGAMGFGNGFTTALIGGASFKQAIKSGLQSAGSAMKTAYVQAFISTALTAAVNDAKPSPAPSPSPDSSSIPWLSPFGASSAPRWEGSPLLGLLFDLGDTLKFQTGKAKIDAFLSGFEYFNNGKPEGVAENTFAIFDFLDAWNALAALDKATAGASRLTIPELGWWAKWSRVGGALSFSYTGSDMLNESQRQTQPQANGSYFLGRAMCAGLCENDPYRPPPAAGH